MSSTIRRALNPGTLSTVRPTDIDCEDALWIRRGTRDDIGRIQQIETAAGAVFVDVAMPEIADDLPPEAALLGAAIDRQQLWVAGLGQTTAGYGFASIVDGHAHLEQASVDPDFGGRRIGRSIILHMVEWARRSCFPCTSLTTFADVPWNAPYYRTFGFRDWPEQDVGPELHALLDAERATDLGNWRRVVMITTF